MALGFSFNPVKFVLEKGDERDRFRLLVAAGLKDHPFVRDYVGKLERMQNPDGGFPRERGKPSSVLSTVGALGSLVQLGADAESPSIRKAVDFFWAKQRADGSWCENPEIKLEKWMTWISTKHGMPIVTGEIAKLLYELGYEKTRESPKP